MLDYIWSFLMIISFVFGIINGRSGQVTQAVFSGAQSAVTLCLTFAGTIALWSGLMNIAEKSGITKALSATLKPIIKLLFPGLNPKSPAARAICMNISANMLGLGNAATPFGLEAMKQLDIQNPVKGVASNHMITFVVVNTASIQIIPTTIAMLRSKYGSSNPMDIITAVWITSICSLIIGVIIASLLNKNKTKTGKDGLY